MFKTMEELDVNAFFNALVKGKEFGFKTKLNNLFVSAFMEIFIWTFYMEKILQLKILKSNLILENS